MFIRKNNSVHLSTCGLVVDDQDLISIDLHFVFDHVYVLYNITIYYSYISSAMC